MQAGNIEKLSGKTKGRGFLSLHSSSYIFVWDKMNSLFDARRYQSHRSAAAESYMDWEWYSKINLACTV
jgi:hypothetical protein